jgi:ribulose-phosphate 3-epimerase
MLKDVHLLIDKPEKHIEAFAKAGADIIVFSVEYCTDISQALKMISRMENVNDTGKGILRGVSLNPQTPINVIAPVMDDIDVVVLLALGPEMAAMGPDVIVTGSAVFDGKDAAGNLKSMMEAIDG